MEDVKRLAARVVLLSSGKVWLLLNLAYYEVAEGDLILISRAGWSISIAAGDWVGIGTLEHTDGISWVALDHHAEAAA